MFFHKRLAKATDKYVKMSIFQGKYYVTLI